MPRCRAATNSWTAARSNSWMASYLGDAASGAGLGEGLTNLCGVPPTRSELRSALPPFALEKITCTNYLLDATSNFEGGDVFSGD